MSKKGENQERTGQGDTDWGVGGPQICRSRWSAPSNLAEPTRGALSRLAGPALCAGLIQPKSRPGRGGAYTARRDGLSAVGGVE